MPYTKSISIHATVHKTLKYILNPDKTESLLYASSMNCMTNADDAYLEMKSIYEHYSGKKYNAPLPSSGKGAVKAIHYIQAFDPKDNVSPELAHRIAKAFARKTFGDDVQVVIATHKVPSLPKLFHLSTALLYQLRTPHSQCNFLPNSIHERASIYKHHLEGD